MNLASQNSEPGFPPRFIQLKQEIAGGREAELTASWGTLLDALKQRTEQFIQIGSNVRFSLEAKTRLTRQLFSLSRKSSFPISRHCRPTVLPISSARALSSCAGSCLKKLRLHGKKNSRPSWQTTLTLSVRSGSAAHFLVAYWHTVSGLPEDDKQFFFL